MLFGVTLPPLEIVMVVVSTAVVVVVVGDVGDVGDESPPSPPQPNESAPSMRLHPTVFLITQYLRCVVVCAEPSRASAFGAIDQPAMATLKLAE
jgi:hypothetical protein